MTKFFPCFLQLVNLLLVRPQTLLEKASASCVVLVCLARRNHCCRLCVPALNSTALFGPCFPPQLERKM